MRFLLGIPAVIAAGISLDLSSHVAEYCGAQLVETSTWLQSQSPELFWSFIDGITSDEKVSDPLDHAKKILNDNTLFDLCKSSVESRTYSSIAGIYKDLYERITPPADCRSWIQYGQGKLLCTTEKLPILIDKLADGKLVGLKLSDNVVPAFDRYISRDLTAFPVLVLWADPHNIASWASLHRALAEQARVGEITYVLRFIVKEYGCELEGENIRLDGFGVSVEVKGDEGGAIDTEEAKKVFKEAELDAPALDFNKIPNNLSESELAELGLKGAQLITTAKDPLQVFKAISGNLPLLARSLAKWTAPKGSETSRALIEKLSWYHKRYQLLPQVELIAINGILVEAVGFNLASLRAFTSRYRSLHSATLGKLENGPDPEAVLRAGVQEDALAYDTRSEAVLWLNNLETDELHAKEPKTLRSILRYSNTGFFGLSRNLVNAVLYAEPKDAARHVKQLEKAWIVQGAPVRFGLVLANPNESDSNAKFIKAFYGIADSSGAIDALKFLDKCAEEEEDLEKCFEELQLSKTFDDFADSDKARSLALENKNLITRLGITSEEGPMFFFNGRPVQVSLAASFDHAIAAGYKSEIAQLQQLVYKQELKDEQEDLYGTLLEMRAAHQFRNEKLVGGGVKGCVDVAKVKAGHWTQLMEPKLHLYPTHNQPNSKDFRPTTTTIWLVVDVNKRHELDLINSAMLYLHNTKQPVRLHLLFANPIERHLKSLLLSYRELLAGKFDYEGYTSFLEKAVNLRQAGVADYMKIKGVKSGGRRSSDYEIGLTVRSMVQAVLVASGVGPYYRDPMIFVDGQLVATVGKDDPKVLSGHFEMLVQRESQRLARINVSSATDEDIIRITSFQFHALAALQNHFGTGQRDIGVFPPVVPDFPSFATKKKQGLVHVQAIIDPLSQAAQRYAHVLDAVKDEAWLSAKTWLNPSLLLNHLPLPIFYRFTQNRQISFPAAAGTFTAQPDVPPSWDAMLDEGSADPDNLSSATGPVHMALRGLVAEAKFEVPSGRTLGGVYIEARDALTHDILESAPMMGDINVAQFGKLARKLYYLTVEAHAKDIFKLEHTDVEFCGGSGRNLAYHNLKQLQALPPKSSLSAFTPNSYKNDKRIHVFSIASGAMYERLIRIMMVSVLKNAKAEVKFWLIDSFVQPEFRESVRVLGKIYGFEYEFVHVRWPVWLRRQAKKHRTVWAYKILFLDQIFPAELDRVIYVDADQVLRSDLSELMTTKLDEKAPWAFVPFCDSRKETDQFRFWKAGYWKEVLAGKPYHISALFLLDLAKLRASGLADRLRRDYHMLSLDPNSLANLDQDLPNHLQDEFPIHSLPQEWLWCETWCSDDTKGVAKSIDLCNYPGKKESKLEQGKRIIKEWKEYDHEVDFIVSNTVRGKKEKLAEKADL